LGVKGGGVVATEARGNGYRGRGEVSTVEETRERERGDGMREERERGGTEGAMGFRT